MLAIIYFILSLTSYCFCMDITNVNTLIPKAILTARYPLHVAALRNSPDIIYRLCIGSFDPNLTDETSSTALDCAINCNKPESVAAILLCGGKINSTGTDLSAVLKNIIRKNRLTVAHNLMVAGAKINPQNRPIMKEAYERKSLILISILLDENLTAFNEYLTTYQFNNTHENLVELNLALRIAYGQRLLGEALCLRGYMARKNISTRQRDCEAIIYSISLKDDAFSLYLLQQLNLSDSQEDQKFKAIFLHYSLMHSCDDIAKLFIKEKEALSAILSWARMLDFANVVDLLQEQIVTPSIAQVSDNITNPETNREEPTQIRKLVFAKESHNTLVRRRI